MAQTKDGYLSSAAQKSICDLIGDGNREALDTYLGIIRKSTDERFVSLKESYTRITCMRDFSVIQWAALNRKTRLIATMVNEYGVPINSIDRNGESELDRLDYLDREKGDIDGSSNYGRVAKYLRKKLAERGN